MHGTIGSMHGCGGRFDDRLGQKRRVRSVLAAIGFFLLIFGSASIGMGAAIGLSGSSFGRTGSAWNAADAAAHNNDGYLEEYARGPGRGQAPCASQPHERQPAACG